MVKMLLALLTALLWSGAANALLRDIPDPNAGMCTLPTFLKLASDEQENRVTQCAYRFISKVLLMARSMNEYLTREIPGADLREAVRLYPEETNKRRQLMIDLFREYEWLFPSIIENQEELSQFAGIQLVPLEVYEVVVDSIKSYLDPKSKTTKTPYALLFTSLFGCEVNIRTKARTKKTEKLPGLAQYVSEMNLQEWHLVDNFSRGFRRTLVANTTSREISNTFDALIAHYFEYMHVQNRLYILTKMADLIADVEQHHVFFSKLESISAREAEKIATVHLFQNTGPVFIKLLQTLNEAVGEGTIIAPILKGLPQMLPMPWQIVDFNLQDELKSMLDGRQRTRVFSPSLYRFEAGCKGIASIAQTHFFEYDRRELVVKVQKREVKNVFQLERQSINNMISASISGTGLEDGNGRPMARFDKGIKQRLNNYMNSIEEELNFNIERQNIINGMKAYTDPEHQITVAEVPKEFLTSKNPDVLIMKKAVGKDMKYFIEEGTLEEKKKALRAVQTLFEKFLRVALEPNQSSGFQFYHGDLHRGNFFLDNKDTDQITLIDFGNAGVIGSAVAQQITEILVNTQKTGDTTDEAQTKAIRKVARNFYKIAQDSIAAQFATFPGATQFKDEREGFIAKADEHVRLFFENCFDPALFRPRRDDARILAMEKSDKLRAEAAALKKQIATSATHDVDRQARQQFKLDLLEDNIGLLDAVINNCLCGFSIPIVTEMKKSSEELSASGKLKKVFAEVEKNGIAMPKEIALFNKSLMLLEDIQANLYKNIKASDGSFRVEKNANDIFLEVLEGIRTAR